MKSHDLAHDDDPANYWGECDICADRVQGDIDEGHRCSHGIAGGCAKCELAADAACERDAFPNK